MFMAQPEGFDVNASWVSSILTDLAIELAFNPLEAANSSSVNASLAVPRMRNYNNINRNPKRTTSSLILSSITSHFANLLSSVPPHLLRKRSACPALNLIQPTTKPISAMYVFPSAHMHATAQRPPPLVTLLLCTQGVAAAVWSVTDNDEVATVSEELVQL
ncbi:hypothetical protein HYPSUDRAFT_209524 [Hypholoma sublateritium FD-334 SS-4]|uniref:Uncharacterized protein n=1 Tax=Hypholoma sublateritium (strain FD-334 SS-4) TaxID=945553 RepID=A0A0D2N2H7_HYPSF|nr:hypothetical protein HYPSUDRAFT_209524 [Hypholoma sublateritium FD-334 SS-4]